MSAWTRARNILAVRLDGMGDVIMTTPALRALRRSGARVTLLSSHEGAAIAAHIDEVDDVMVHRAPWMKSAPEDRCAADEHALAETIRARAFDGAVIFTVFTQSPLPAAYLCFLAEVPLRGAYCRENPYQLLTDWFPEPDERSGTVRHEVRRHVDLVESLGFDASDATLSLRVPESGRTRARELLVERGIDLGQPWLLVHPGATASSRRYPPEMMAAAADLLVRRHGLRVIFSGGPGDRDVVDAVRASMASPSVSLAGESSLGDLIGLVAEAPVVLTNNTGPAHIAAAVGSPVVVTYALTNTQHTPWSDRARVLYHDVPCKFCLKSVCPEGHHACLRMVEPAEVARAVGELLDRYPQTSPRVGSITA